ncbi:hypothetical protein BS47DRAFT_72508 [Hydnum rufescens UP504]|uniref:Secreted protein n=1 Tax=Hydnum rufescens UP504 TaxID=1448309 RepID=A0A9P6E199_9AGAM|nr:hypothetical protein BS47DRAFT_72508 [Hydnum rufescens UP504]
MWLRVANLSWTVGRVRGLATTWAKIHMVSVLSALPQKRLLIPRRCRARSHPPKIQKGAYRRRRRVRKGRWGRLCAQFW